MERRMRLPAIQSTCLLLLTLLAGCAELSGLNPYYRQQWAEDERIMPSFHSYLKQVRDLESQAASMSAAEQERVAADLTRLIREDKNTLLRLAAVRSLSAYPPHLSKTGIFLAASDANDELRVMACAALGRLGDEESINLLASLVEQDEDLDVRIAATGALAGRREDVVFRALALALEDTDPALQYRAMQALQASSGRNYGNNVALWRSWLQGENPAEPVTSVAERIRSLSPF